MTEALRKKHVNWLKKKRIHELMRTFGIVGESDAIEVAFRQALRVGHFSDLAVLITGESGTGKELMARAIHQLDPKRRAGPFVAINCGAISSGLAESELFGHSKGAFTGADRDRKGLVRAADGGVLFLDEIGELGSDVQAKLLRVLQDHRVMTRRHRSRRGVNRPSDRGHESQFRTNDGTGTVQGGPVPSTEHAFRPSPPLRERNGRSQTIDRVIV